MSIVVKNLTKYFGKTKAVDNLSFEVEPGEIIGFLGPNGAGKTTTARMITGYLAPTSGTIEIHGKDIQKDPYEARKMIGYLPEENPLYPDMDVVDYLDFIARLQGVNPKNILRSIKEVVKIFQLQDVKHLDIGQVSKGYRQRVGLAQAVIHDPPVLILDEPTNGLDPNQVVEFRNFIRNLAKRKTVILSTHALAEVQALCSRVIIIGKGRILADASIEELERKFKGREGFLVEVSPNDSVTVEIVQRYLESVENIEAVASLSTSDEHETMKFYIESQGNRDIRRQLFNLCVEKRWTLLDMHRQRVRIEDIFQQLTMGKTSK